MGAKEFGRLIDRRMQDRGWTQAYLAWRLSEPPDRIWNETMIRRLRLGQRHLDPHLVQRLVEIFELDDAQAVEMWYAAGLWPPKLTMDEVRRLHAKATTPTLEPEPEPKPEAAESAPAASAQSGTQRKGSPTRQPAPVAAVAA